MKYKLVGTDFDGSFLKDDKKVPIENYSSLECAKKNKWITVGVTARVLDGTRAKINIHYFDYLLLNNGSYIYDVEKDKVISKATIPWDVVEKVTEEMINKATQIDYCTLHKYYILKGEDVGLSFIKPIKSIEEVEEEVARINLFINQDNIEIERDILQNNYPNMNVFIMQDSDSNRKWLVMNPNNINKEKGLENLGRILNIKLKEMVFFGDGLNDIEAIEKVGLGVALKNALPEVKSKAKDITKENNNDGGVGKYLLDLIKKQKRE